jgi:hypothetical protein
MRTLTATLIASLALISLPGEGLGQGQVEEQIRQTILDNYALTAERLADQPQETSTDGSLAFWSSGGLLQEVSRDDTPVAYESFNLVPKHIQVVTLGDGVAMAQFYVEGSYQPEGGAPVPHYLTRATQVYVLEGGEWKVRGAHFSPVTGGSGTHVTAVK